MIKIFKNIKLRTQLVISFILLSTVPMILLGVFLYRTVRKEMLSQAQQNLIENVRKSNIIIDNDLTKIKDSAQILNVDNQLYDTFANLDSKDSYSLIVANKKIKEILLRYFSWQESKYSVHLVTSYFRFGEENKNYYPAGQFEKSSITKAAKNNKGALLWVPTYNYTEMFGIRDIPNEQLDYGYLFSAVSQLSISKAKNGVVQRLPSNIEQPILVINFKEDYLLSLLQKYSNNTNLKLAEYAVISKDGKVITDSNKDEIAKYYSDNWFKKIGDESIGSMVTKLDGQEKIVCYAVSDVTGWITFIALPSKVFTQNVVKKFFQYLCVVTIAFVILSFLLSYFISEKISKKVHRILKTIDQVGEGDFDSYVRYSEEDEFAFFYNKINTMSKNIKILIHENFEVKLRQKDFQIMVLNIQLNPHFLYNTLNIINWICLSGDTKKSSSMIVGLSRMLHYTSDNSKELTLLRDDIAWLKRYTYIMGIRYEDKFTVNFDIPEELMQLKIPKLFLQPLIENAIIHGFKYIQHGGKLIISAMNDQDNIIFTVEDNGVGMGKAQVENIMNRETNYIGISNTNRRIKILFGEEYGIHIHSKAGEGTIVMITLPKNN